MESGNVSSERIADRDRADVRSYEEGNIMVLLRAGSRAGRMNRCCARTLQAAKTIRGRKLFPAATLHKKRTDRLLLLLQRRNEGLTRSAYLELHYDVLSSLFYSSIPYTPLRLNFILYLFELVCWLNVELRVFKCGLKEGNAFH